MFFNVVPTVLQNRSQHMATVAAFEPGDVFECKSDWRIFYCSENLDQMQQACAAQIRVVLLLALAREGLRVR